MVRVDSRRLDRDFPPARLADDSVPTGGWWNYSGHPARGLPAQARERRLPARVSPPELPCGTCAATVRVQINLRNVTRRGQRVHGHGQVRRPDAQPRHEGARPERDRVVHGHGPDRAVRGCGRRRPRTSTTSASPCATDGRKVAGYTLHSGIRSIKVSNGRLFLNGQALNLRGVGVHEEGKGAGLRDRQRPPRSDRQGREGRSARRCCARTTRCTRTRTSWPTGSGLLVWSEIPVYRVRDEVFREPSVRRLAVNELSRNILANENHPSVMVWSIGNELSTRPGPVQTAYISSAARLAKQMDPSRPVALRGRRLPELALPGRAVRADRRPRRSTTTSAGTRGRAGRSSTARSSPATSTRPAPATRTRP